MYSVIVNIALAQCKDHKYIETLPEDQKDNFSIYVLHTQFLVKKTIKEYKYNFK